MREINMQNIKSLDWEKNGGLIPAIVTDPDSGEVLMLGFMNEEALIRTLSTQHVTFYSRTRETIWQKGSTSGHFLRLERITTDCDSDTLLVQASPLGPTCHTGARTCFGDQFQSHAAFLYTLEAVIQKRALQNDNPKSYTKRLLNSGVQRIAQKVGEEGVETALAAVNEDDEAFLAECADLIYHLMVLLRARELSVRDVLSVLRQRHAQPSTTND